MTLEEGMNLARGKNGKAEFFAVCLYWISFRDFCVSLINLLLWHNC
jgi:hypothetical protein